MLAGCVESTELHTDSGVTRKRGSVMVAILTTAAGGDANEQ